MRIGAVAVIAATACGGPGSGAEPSDLSSGSPGSSSGSSSGSASGGAPVGGSSSGGVSGSSGSSSGGESSSGSSYSGGSSNEAGSPRDAGSSSDAESPRGGSSSGVGGSSSGSSSSSGGSSSGSTTGGGCSACGVAPVDAQAIPQVKNLLCFLYSVYGKKVISGQQETSWVANPSQDAQQIQSATGKTPALRGGDFLYQQTEQGGTTTDRALAQWKSGGISQLIYHMGNPTGNDSYASAKTSCGSGCIADAITAGSAKNGVLTSRLNHAVTELLKLQAANVAVVWRPWHESNGGWFWWGMESGAQFVALYKYEFQYFI
jgi:Glycosyl hydrolase family 26